MAKNVKGQKAIEILRRKEVFQAFTDDANPISIQVTNRLYFLNTADKEKIRNARDKGSMDAAVAIHEVLIKNYNDDDEGTISLEDFIEAMENQRTNVKLSKMLRAACEGQLAQPPAAPSQPVRTGCLNAPDEERLSKITPTLIRDGDAIELSKALRNTVFNDNDIGVINKQSGPAQRVQKMVEIYGQKATSLGPLRQALRDECQHHIVDEMDSFDGASGNSQTTHQGQSSTGAGASATDPIRGKKAMAILKSRPVSTQFKLVNANELAPLLSPWFITAKEKQQVTAGLLQSGDTTTAADRLFDIIVAHFEQGKDDVSLQDLIETLIDTEKYQNLIAALEKACK